MKSASTGAPAAPQSTKSCGETRIKLMGAALVLLATFGLALKGIWARFAYSEGLDVGGVLFYRSALSAPLVLAGGWWLLRAQEKRASEAEREKAQLPVGHVASASQMGAPRRFTWRDYAPGAALGGMFSVGMMCDFEAIAQLGASVSRVVLFGFPLVVMLLEAVRKRQLPSKRSLLGFSVAWLGLFFVAQKSALGTGESVAASPSTTALLWGVASMVFYALYVWLSGDLSRKLGSVRLTSVSNLATAAVVVSFMLFQGQGQAPAAAPGALFWVVVMVLVSTVVPYFMLMEGIKRLGSAEASLLAMTGPLVTVAAGWLLLGEQLSALQLAGTAATLLGVGLARG